jgi:hypothetical protein
MEQLLNSFHRVIRTPPQTTEGPLSPPLSNMGRFGLFVPWLKASTPRLDQLPVKSVAATRTALELDGIVKLFTVFALFKVNVYW